MSHLGKVLLLRNMRSGRRVLGCRQRGPGSRLPGSE